MYKEIIFYSASFLILLFGILTIFFRNIFYSLISAICVFFLAGILFWLSSSEYNAVIQFAVYGFAVPVILGLGIMFTRKGKEEEEKTASASNLKNILLFICGLFILAVVYLVLISLTIFPYGFNLEANLQNGINTYNNFRIFSKGLFIKYVFAFEIISIILTITAAGLTVLKKRRNV